MKFEVSPDAYYIKFKTPPLQQNFNYVTLTYPNDCAGHIALRAQLQNEIEVLDARKLEVEQALEHLVPVGARK